MSTLARSASLSFLLLAGLAVAACGGADATPSVDAGPGVDAAIFPDSGPCDPETPSTECDLFTGCGCNVDNGQKCTVLTDGRDCGPAGDGVRGDTCVTDNQCAAGTLCADYADARTCMAFCDGAHSCGANSACFVRVTTDEGNEARVCGQICTLLDQNCAGKAQGCYPSPSILPNTMEKGICVDGGQVAVGGDCVAANDCAVGSTCLDDGKCHQLCDRNVDGGCPGKTACMPLTGHTTTGICQ